MPSKDIPGRIARRAARADVPVPRDLAERLAAYVDILTRWNRRLNLTALSLEPLTDPTIDRLVVEPLVAARDIWPNDRTIVDIGSGGGSPAVPLCLAAPHLVATMVEVKTRKSAFLREVVRALALRAEVLTMRYEETLTRPHMAGSMDLACFRAVRPDEALWRSVGGLLKPAGRVLWFATGADVPSWPFELSASRALPSPGDRLVVARRAG